MLYSNQVRCTILPQRVVLAIMGFLGIVVSFTMRGCLPIAITEMVQREIIQREIHNDSSYCPADSLSLIDIKHVYSNTTKYNWSQKQQGWILSAYYFGYVASHIPGALLAQKFGGKWTFAFEILTITVCNVLIPPALLYGGENALVLLIILRILMGLGAGPQYPTITVLLAAWVPQKETGKLGTLCLSGGVVCEQRFLFGLSTLGTLLSFLVSGLILSIWTWPVVFYFWSVLGVIWFIIFISICYKDPASHPFITKKEQSYLEKEIGQLERKKTLPPTPWRSILTSVPVIALTIGQTGSDFAEVLFQSDMPKYMSEVLGYSAQDIGLFSSIPYLLMWNVSLTSGALCDYLISHQYISVTHARKMFTALCGVQVAFLVLASHAECNKFLFVACLVLSSGFKGMMYSGMRVNALDLSPNYAGSILSIVNACGASMGIFVPVFVGVMAPESTMYQWRVVFWTIFVINMVTISIFLTWASGEIQPWNEPNECEEQSENNGVKKCERQAY